MTERDPAAPAPPRPSCVLVVHNRYRIRGGEDSVFEAECRLLEEAGIRVIRYERSNDDIPDGGGPFAKLGLALCTVWNPRTYREVREILRRERPDAMHCHNTFPQISPSVYYAAAREGVPVVQTLHNYRLACLDGYLFRDGRVCERCLGRAPLPGVCRRCYRGSLSASATLAAMLLFHRLLGTWRRKVTRYIALTDFAKEKFVQAGLPACKISVKPNAFVASDEGVGLRATVERSGASAPGRQQRVVYVGRLSSEKGVDVLLRAWALLQKEGGADQNARPSQAPSGPGAAAPRHGPAPTCKIIGDGPERAALEGLAAELGIASSVRFLGALPRKAALRELAASDLLVLPSLCYETFGLAVVEAASMGIAAIVPAHSAPSSLVRDGVTGRHFSSGDPVALASALRDLLSDPAALRRMGAAARAAFEASDCRPDRNLARLLSVYASSRSAHDA